MEVHQLCETELFTYFCDRGARAAHLTRIHFCLTSLGIRFHKHMHVITVAGASSETGSHTSHTFPWPYHSVLAGGSGWENTSEDVNRLYVSAPRIRKTSWFQWEFHSGCVCLCYCVAMLSTKPQRVEDLRKGCLRRPRDIRFRTDVLKL